MMNPYSFRSLLLAALLPAILSLAPFQASRAGDGCPADAGTLTSDFGPICLLNGHATLTGVPNEDALVPDGFTTIYVLTRTNGLIIEQVSADPVFTVNSEDVWRLHSLVYDPTTLDLSVVQLGSTNAYQVQDLLVQGGGSICAALDISGAPVKTGICPCDADAGGITTDFGPICLVNGEATLTGVPTGNAEVPAGYSTLFVLTRTNGLIIEQVSADPVFTVTTEDVWRIHTLVYDPATLDLSIVQFGSTNAYQVQDLLIQGGGAICASLDINGAAAKTGICEQVCTADAGTISADQADLCLTNGSAMLMATPDGNANVPVGYQMIFVLTEGPDLVITNAGPVPMFTVNDPGAYIIHSLVYDPATLDLSSIVFGETTGAAVNSLLQQGGGSICASLDLVGAQFQVADCTPLCTADAGTLTATEPELCLVNGLATMTAVPSGDAVVPDGFVVAYVLTRGPELFIQNVEPDPEFEWPLTGEYTVHTLVYDPATLDLGWIQFDVSTGFDVNALLLQGGGSICGSLDVLGASFTITQCEEPCTANAGSNASVTVCSNAPAFDLSSFVNGDPGGSWSAPNGIPHPSIFSPGLDAPGTYMYVVSATEPCPNDTAFITVAVSLAPDAGISAQIVVCDTAPAFSCLVLLGGNVDQGGTWTSPNGAPFSGIFNPSVDAPGIYVYTVPGSGPCASATAMVMIMVETCAPACDADAGIGGDVLLCFNGPVVDLFSLLTGTPDAGGMWFTPDGQVTGGVFDPSADPQGVYTYFVTDGPDCPSDTTNLVVSLIECESTCTADAGTLTAEQSTLCLLDGTGLTTMTAIPNGDSNVPPGFEVLYVLTRGPELFIQNVEPDPSFEWPLTGDYTIHTLVYDPNTLDLSGILFDVTTGFDINNLLIQGGGPICGSLDVEGAPFTISICPTDPCAGAAGLDTTVEVCQDGSVIELLPLLAGEPVPGGTWFSTNPLDQGLVLGGNGFYDSMVGPGSLLGYFVSAGPDCAPDTAFLDLVLVQCPPIIGEAPIIDKGTTSEERLLSLWPNPTVDQLRLTVDRALSAAARVDVLDATGRIATVPVTFSGTAVDIDARSLTPGTWTVRVIDGNSQHTGRFVRAPY